MKRKTKHNHYVRFFIQDGLTCYFVHTNKGVITWVRERIYLDDTEEDMKERNIDSLPEFYQQEILKLLA